MNHLQKYYDVLIIGSGHNGLVAANYLAMAGKSVLVVERNHYLGGATTSQRVFPDFEANLSRYSYLVSLLPSQIIQELGLNIRLLQRKYASYTPYIQADKPVGLPLRNGDDAYNHQSVLALGYGEREWTGYQALLQKQQTFASLVWDSFLEPLQTKDFFKKTFQHTGNKALWQEMVEEPIGYLIEKHIASDVLRGVLMTDAKIGSFTQSFDKNLLQNKTFLYHVVGNKTGEWRVPEGGMGNLAQQLIQKAEANGVTFCCHAQIKHMALGSPRHQVQIDIDGKLVDIDTQYILCNASNRVLEQLLGNSPSAPEPEDEGTAFKINMLLQKLPTLKDPNTSPEEAFAGTFHINQSHSQMERTFEQASQGQIPETLAGEIYCHTLTDPSIISSELQKQGFHTLTYFGLDLPYSLFVTDNQDAKKEVVKRFLTGINEYLAEPLEDCLARDTAGNLCLEAKSAFDLEQDLQMPRGNIFHNALSWFFAENEAEIGQWGVETPYARVYVCGSSAKRGGAVSGIPGRNAARLLLS